MMGPHITITISSAETHHQKSAQDSTRKQMHTLTTSHRKVSALSSRWSTGKQRNAGFNDSLITLRVLEMGVG
jgi:hypothetical protein